jgi:hypothetical protein
MNKEFPMRTTLAVPHDHDDHDDDPTTRYATDRARFRALAPVPESAPLDLFTGAPVPNHTPGMAALAWAYAHLCAHFPPTDPTASPYRSTAAQAFIALQEHAWTVHPGGVLEIADHEATCVVRDSGCCRMTQANPNLHALTRCHHTVPAAQHQDGICAHRLARELVRLAQLLETNDPPPVFPAPTTTAEAFLPFVTIPGRLLGLALGIARVPRQAVTLTIDDEHLVIGVGTPSRHVTRLTGVEGQGRARVRLDPTTFAQLWQPFRPVASHLPLVTLFVDLSDGLVLLSNGDFAVEVQGVLR